MKVDRIKELKIMKTLRYLLMVVAMVSVLSVKAQGTTQLPEVQMQSTSVMIGSGSALPQAATTGAYVTGATPGSYSPAKAPGHVRTGLGGGGGGGEPGDRPEPWKDPIGDAVWPLMALASVYAVLRVYRRKRSV